MKRAAALLAAIVSFLVGSASVAEEKAGAPAQQQKQKDSPKPKAGETLGAGIEEKLRWGEPANGLRVALFIRPVPGEPEAKDAPELYLVLQNVSKAPIRVTDADEPANRHEFSLKMDGRTLLGIGFREPTLGDVLLQPREVAFLRMFPSERKDPAGQSAGSIVAEGALKDTHQTMIAKLNIGQAPAGAWTGKLVTAETSGADAAPKPEPKARKASDAK